MNKKVSIKLIIASILVAISFSVTIGAKVLAETSTSKPDSKVKMHEKWEKRHGFIEGFTDEQISIIKVSMVESMKNAMNSLVSKGTITKEQSDKILAHDKEIFKSLSVEQKEALRTAMETARKDSLQKLVKNGKITQEQADKLSKVRGNHKKD